MKNLSITKIAQIISIVLGFMLMASPLLASAQLTFPGSGGTGLQTCFNGACTISQLILTVINIILALAGLVAVLVLIIGGFRYVVSFGNEEAVGTAKKMILNALLGIIIIVLAFVIVNVIERTLTNPSNI